MPDWRRLQRIADSIDLLLACGVKRLESFSDTPRADALLLLSDAIGRSREWIVAHGDGVLTTEEGTRFFDLCERRILGTPVAYLLGTAHFYGREFFVNPAVLVPRPETECLIDEVLPFIGNRPLRVLDVGTGSGAIACTIAAETKAVVDATDVSLAAIEVARENAQALGVADRCAFYHGDLVDPVRGKRYDAILANLPYIPTNDLPRPPDPTSYEPRIALDGGPDGLVHYRRLLPVMRSVCSEEALLLLEAAPPTMDSLVALARESLAECIISVGKDYAGCERFIRAVRSEARSD